MIKSIRIEQLRGFDSFEMLDLGRINLIVGTNNCGKTTVLEGIQLLTSTGDVSTIGSILTRRGEDFWDEGRDGRLVRHVDVRRLLHGHAIEPGTGFSIQAVSDSGPLKMEASIVDLKGTVSPFNPYQGELFAEADDTANAGHFGDYKGLMATWASFSNGPPVLFLSRKGGLSLESIRRVSGSPGSEMMRKNLLITAAALSPEVVIELFESIVLTTEEESVVEALQVIEPSIERIATSGSERIRTPSTVRQTGARGGMLLRCKGVKDRIPIGSMGDGIWRMLGLSLALARAQGGMLLVDEIDTGLHFSVLSDMWRLIYKAAHRLNVQVFASTHSRDCFESLAVICRETVSEGSDITIQRIERGKKTTVAYTEQEIIAAADRGMEVR